MAFAIGFILAVVGGIVARDNGGIVLVLMIAGIVVSLLTITTKEVMIVMVAAIALIVTGSVGAFTPWTILGTGLARC